MRADLPGRLKGVPLRVPQVTVVGVQRQHFIFCLFALGFPSTSAELTGPYVQTVSETT